MKQAEQLPRAAVGWIILAQALLLLPHLPRVPGWVIAIYVLAFFWRIQALRGRLELPAPWLKVVLSVAASGGIVLSFGSLLGMEPMVAFLLAAFALKLTEMRSRKDAYVLLFLGYFVCLTQFLFSQDLLLVGYGLVLVWVLTTALLCVHRDDGRLFDGRPPRLAALMLAQAFPLMLVLFFLFPRIGPLWSMPLKSNAAQTGMSGTLRPGDVSNLSQSDEIAFRVQFAGAIPPPSALYWRGLVMSLLEDGTWRSLRYFEVPAALRREPPVLQEGESLSYRVLIKPTQQNWLYGLRYARAERPGVLHLPDFRLFSPVEIENETLYRVRSWPGATLEPDLSDWRRRVETALPAGDNPETRALARRLRAASASDRDFVQAALGFFGDGSFRYTLRPPLLPPENAMDGFLFGERRGFCEHFAYAFTVMMRAAGVPARIVAGYLGGEVNPVDRTVLVHQFDAHAWSEVWLAGEGWVRVDPTAVVAPDRINFGLERAVAEEGSFLADSPLSPLRFRNVDWVNAVRLRYEALTYRWQSWMTGFDGSAQFDLLKAMLGEVSVSRSLLLLFGSAFLVLGGAALLLFRRGPQAPARPFEAELRQYRELLRGRGIEAAPGEGTATLTERAAARWPQQAPALRALNRVLSLRLYGPPVRIDDPVLRRSVKRQLRSLRRAL